MLLGIPLLAALLILIGPFVAIAIPGLPAAVQWPTRGQRRTARYDGWADATWA